MKRTPLKRKPKKLSAPDDYRCRDCDSRAADFAVTCDDCGDLDACGACGWCKCKQGSRAFLAPKRPRKQLKRKNAKRAKERRAANFGPQAELCRQLPCAGCPSMWGSEPAHHPSRGAGGDDGDLAPLCPECHGLQHQVGVVEFQARHFTDLQLVAAALRALVASPAGQAKDETTKARVRSRARSVVLALRNIGVDPRTGGHAPVRAPRRKVGR